MGISKNWGTPKSFLIGFSTISHPFSPRYPYFWALFSLLIWDHLFFDPSFQVVKNNVSLWPEQFTPKLISCCWMILWVQWIPMWRGSWWTCSKVHSWRSLPLFSETIQFAFRFIHGLPNGCHLATPPAIPAKKRWVIKNLATMVVNKVLLKHYFSVGLTGVGRLEGCD